MEISLSVTNFIYTAFKKKMLPTQEKIIAEALRKIAEQLARLADFIHKPSDAEDDDE